MIYVKAFDNMNYSLHLQRFTMMNSINSGTWYIEMKWLESGYYGNAKIVVSKPYGA